MFKITFYNDKGSVVFGGGTSQSNFKIIKADGLGLIKKNYVTAYYENTYGGETVSKQVMQRTITLCGDFFLGDNYCEEYSNALYVLNSEGVMEIEYGIVRRRIGARCTELIEGERQGHFLPFTIQFVCDNPYFESSEQIETALYKVFPNLNSEFSFPGAFSVRVAERNIFIESNAETEPIFLINTGENPTGSLEIINNTSGEKLKINYESLPNENIVIDVKNKKIYNQNGDNLLSCLSDDSFFDGFHLYPGDNVCEVRLDSGTLDLQVFVRYRENYVGAI